MLEQLVILAARETFLIRKVSTVSMKISEKILTQSSRGLMAPADPQLGHNTSGRILRYFCLETNIEGINNAGRSRSLVRAAVWLGIFLIFLALTISDMTELIRGISTFLPLKLAIFHLSNHCRVRFASSGCVHHPQASERHRLPLRKASFLKY